MKEGEKECMYVRERERESENIEIFFLCKIYFVSFIFTSTVPSEGERR